MSSFDDAFVQLDADARTLAGRAVSYRRGEAMVDWDCVVGKTLFDSIDQNNTITQWEARDYIGPVAELILDGEPTTPKHGDRIYDTVGGATLVFEVLAPHGSVCFTYSDPEQTTVRVHTKFVGEAT